MRTTGLEILPVVDIHDTFLGFVHINEVIQAAKRKDPTVESIIHMHVPSVSKDVTVEEMLPLISETRSPIAVVNDHNRLLGIVTQTSLIIEATKFNEEEINELKDKANNQ
ncbi:CBS domain-containing protein [Sphingobacterium sp. KU25419]|nr:CBS domain-containing protein [Sphingobacterium sp. KU25419]